MTFNFVVDLVSAYLIHVLHMVSLAKFTENPSRGTCKGDIEPAPKSMLNLMTFDL